ncbi:MAG: hypothetical protein H7843_09235 [Nitrospirota bacterium]
MNLKATLSVAILTAIASAFLLCPASADYILLDNVTITGPGTAKIVTHQSIVTWSCDVDMDNSSTALTVRIEGNVYGDKFSPKGMGQYTLDSEELAAGKATFSIDSLPVNKIRAYVVSLTGRIKTLVCMGVQKQ